MIDLSTHVAVTEGLGASSAGIEPSASMVTSAGTSAAGAAGTPGPPLLSRGTTPSTNPPPGTPFSLRAYARAKNWGAEPRRAVGFTAEILLQTFLFFWIGGLLGSSVHRLSVWMSPVPTAEERKRDEVNRRILIRDLCVTVPLLIVAYFLLRTLLVWGYEKAIFRRVLNRYAPDWFHYEAYKIFGAYALASGMGATNPSMSAKTAALFGVM